MRVGQWTEEKDLFLKEYFGSLSIQALESHLKIPFPSIKARCSVLGILDSERGRFYHKKKRESWWTPERVSLLTLRFPFEEDEVIARDLGTTASAVQMKGSRLGLHKQPTVNINYFEGSWHPRMAYVAGYIHADGSLHWDEEENCLYMLQLGCARQDRDFLILIRDELGSRHSVHDSEEYCSNGTLCFATRCSITSKKLVGDLMARTDLCPNKSAKDLPFPTYLPENCVSHYLRGYYDGDGWISDCEGRLYLGFAGTLSFITGLRDYLSSLLSLYKVSVSPDKSVFQVTWSSRDDVQKLTRYLYDECGNLFLTRKKEKLEHLLESMSVAA